MKYIIILVLITYINTLPTIPNINYMECGFNLKYGDPLNMTISRPIFEAFTYNNKQTILINGVNYKMPDQLYGLNYPSEDKKSSSLIYYSASMVSEELYQTFTLGFDCKRIDFAFSMSEQVNYFNYMYNTQGCYTANTYLTITVSKMEINSLIKLNDEFKKTINLLPNTYTNETCKYFMDFFDMFGTAFFTKTVYGGYVSMTSAFDISVSYNKNSYEIGLDLGAQFLVFTGNLGAIWNETQAMKYIDSTYDSTMYLIGGYPDYYNEDWPMTVPNNPLIVRANVVSITELIKDKNIKNAANLALNDYYMNYSC
ncbi:MAC/perforin domain protein [Hokovirus HKV1]|uniref:MAC/perforin domain protein n=1 Tax=Hokovirus HKV1 TaxID=1977638 RepID=A0A1V0SEM2_9VIRU|nr:MAC/perforin domain protein [Hokovirus HKV1]